MIFPRFYLFHPFLFSCDFIFSRCNYHHSLPNSLGEITVTFLSNLSHKISSLPLMHTVLIYTYMTKSSFWVVCVTHYQIPISHDDYYHWVTLICIIFNICLKYVESTNRPWTWSWSIFDNEMVDHIWMNKYDFELGLITGWIEIIISCFDFIVYLS